MSQSGLGILDAVENLNTLVDAESLNELEVVDDYRLVSHRGEEESEYWIGAGGDEQTLEAIRETFRSIYAYLRASHAKIDTKWEDIEGINTVMVLVGEAAKKLERFGKVFRMNVLEFPEYQKLQKFYQTKLAGRFFRDLTDEVSSVEGHLLNDLNVVLGDHFYELFYLKNEEGHSFYSGDLARKIKLVCDFGDANYFEDDPLMQVLSWQDWSTHLFARDIIATCKEDLERFYHQVSAGKKEPFITFLQKGIMALMFAANPRNLVRQFSSKGCGRYFYDYLNFIRMALHDRAYQRALVYGLAEDEPVMADALALISSLMVALYTLGPYCDELRGFLKSLIPREIKGMLSEKLLLSYGALEEVLAHHPSGPLFKALDLIREEEPPEFDPLMQGNLPEVEVKLKRGNESIDFIRMGSPIKQHVIESAEMIEEFRCYLRSVGKKHLLFNLQDPSAWQEEARCKAFDLLAQKAEFSDCLSIVPWEFEESDFTEALLAQISKTFFGNKKELNRGELKIFNAIARSFIQLKKIEQLHPRYVSFVSKDGLDDTAVATVSLLALLSIAKGKVLDLEPLNALLFGPTLIHRERIILSEPFDQMVAMVQLLEKSGNYLKEFAHLFETFDYKIQIL
ncbi:MAG: hypothetical protein S4CHLAM45_08340 [Chlamydiales bacterium]|nr:hypothetical protein [Chlamydiales bacterium]MCH9620416.1 hypothetical protein [Chlamydiales bacterium]MCH9622938.1 hypothetical protein [Chlamydiales bacterium]